MSDSLWQFVAGALVVAIVYMLVRPSSPAANAVNTVSQALVSIVNTAVKGTPNG